MTMVNNSGPMPTHPGAYLRQKIEDARLPKKQLAQTLGISRSALYQLFAGEIPLTADLSLRLEALFGMPAKTWMDLQVRWDLHQARVVDPIPVTRQLLEQRKQQGANGVLRMPP
jgi:HTH-type transcriptional regulator/antitoxin HigA